MKAAGAIVIIMVSYFLGHRRRAAMLRGEKVLNQLIQLLGELKSAVANSAAGMVSAIGMCASRECYGMLGFLANAAQSAAGGAHLSDALGSSFDSWEHAPLLSKDETAVLKEVFRDLGGASQREETAKLSFAVERLEAARADRRDVNAKRKGYYETLYTLTGTAIAIMLI